eukprot:2095452-Pyramimonas_sp.AAC.1
MTATAAVLAQAGGLSLQARTSERLALAGHSEATAAAAAASRWRPAAARAAATGYAVRPAAA